MINLISKSISEVHMHNYKNQRLFAGFTLLQDHYGISFKYKARMPVKRSF